MSAVAHAKIHMFDPRAVVLQAGLAGVAHIGPDKDYSAVIKAALDSEGWTEGE